ncbi:MAG: hypothetical protein KGI33_06265 [Thaumarchaeota archaeon]|nr:hypothetical protein [Nitrososphaerota archaeon]
MISLTSPDYSNLVFASTSLASFQSPLSAYLGHLKGSMSFQIPAMISFTMFVAAMIIAILGIWISFAFLIVGTIIAFVAYYNIFHEEMIRDETTKILDVIGKNRKNADQVHKTSSAAG